MDRQAKQSERTAQQPQIRWPGGRTDGHRQTDSHKQTEGHTDGRTDGRKAAERQTTWDTEKTRFTNHIQHVTRWSLHVTTHRAQHQPRQTATGKPSSPSSLTSTGHKAARRVLAARDRLCETRGRCTERSVGSTDGSPRPADRTGNGSARAQIAPISTAREGRAPGRAAAELL